MCGFSLFGTPVLANFGCNDLFHRHASGSAFDNTLEQIGKYSCTGSGGNMISLTPQSLS